MRIRSQKQLYFKLQSATIELSKELRETSLLLESLPEYDSVLAMVQSDLNPNSNRSKRGRQGMTAEQVLLASLLKSRKCYSYRELSDATKDSLCSREFLKIEPYKPGFSHKTLQSNIKQISEKTLDYLNEALKNCGKIKGIEDGKKTRTDATAIESNIHHPTDSSQLNDSIRVLSRLLTNLYEDLCVPINFCNHYRASKKKLFKINNSRSPKKRHKLNVELIRLCRKTLKYSKEALVVAQGFQGCKSISEITSLERFISELRHYIPLAEQVLEIAHRRIVLGEKVPASEKIFSIFEEHTDIIVKGQRDIVFGHKATITTGGSGLILDIRIHDGNPSDASLVEETLRGHKEFYQSAPESMVFDGCYSSEENRKLLLGEGVKYLTFSKESDKNATCSRAVRKALRFFRAGIEATVSMLKRMFGWTRVMDKGRESFNKALKTGAIAYNLFILSRISIKNSA
jgi:IS5 family transposase